MSYIEEIRSTTETVYNTKKSTPSTNQSVFEEVLDKEIIIYATPENADNSGSNPSSKISNQESLEQYFQKAAQTYNVDIRLLKALAKQESNFDSNAVSCAGAIGIMQLMPDLAQSMGVTNAYDPEQNIMGGAKYLSQLLTQYDQDITLALAAYNAGPGNVEKYNGVPPFKETQNHIQKVLSYMEQDLSVSDTLSQTGNSSIQTIYSMASQDVTGSSRIYTIYAKPETDSNIG